MLAISLVCGFVSLFGLCMWIRGFGCCFAFCGLEAICVYLLTTMIVLSSYPSWCDCQEYLARFEVSFRVELICCNGPVWLYPVCLSGWCELVDVLSRWSLLARVLEVFECTCPAEYCLYSVNVCSHMWWCMHCCGRMGSFHGTFLECQVGSFDLVRWIGVMYWIFELV